MSKGSWSLNYPGSRSGQDLLFCAITLKASDKTVADGLLEMNWINLGIIEPDHFCDFNMGESFSIKSPA